MGGEVGVEEDRSHPDEAMWISCQRKKGAGKDDIYCHGPAPPSPRLTFSLSFKPFGLGFTRSLRSLFLPTEDRMEESSQFSH